MRTNDLRGKDRGHRHVKNEERVLLEVRVETIDKGDGNWCNQ